MTICPVGLSGQTDGQTWQNLQPLSAVLWTHLKICCGSGTVVGQPAYIGFDTLPHYEGYKIYEKLGLIKSTTVYLTPLLLCNWNCCYGYYWTCILVCSLMYIWCDHMGHHQCSSKWTWTSRPQIASIHSDMIRQTSHSLLQQAFILHSEMNM